MPLVDEDSGSAVVVMNRTDKDTKLLRSILHKIGFRVQSVEDGKKLLDSLAAGDSSLRLVVVDPSTPNSQVQPFLEKLHQAGPQIPVVCVSEDDSASDKLPYTCAAHIGRPFRRAHLLASILELTEKPMARTA
jgi:DNA-binding NtrC family response regulator